MKPFKTHSDLAAAQDAIENFEMRKERGQTPIPLKRDTAAMLRRIAGDLLELAESMCPTQDIERE